MSGGDSLSSIHSPPVYQSVQHLVDKKGKREGEEEREGERNREIIIDVPDVPLPVPVAHVYVSP